MTALFVWHRFIVADRRQAKELLASLRAAANAYGAAGAEVLAAVDADLLVRIDIKEAARIADVALEVLGRARGGEVAAGAVGMMSGEAISERCAGGTVHGGHAITGARTLAIHADPGQLIASPETAAALGATHGIEPVTKAGDTVFAVTVRSAVVHARNLTPRQLETPTGQLRLLTNPPVARATARALGVLDEIAGGTGLQFVVLRGVLGAGGDEFVQNMIQARNPPIVLRIGAAPGGLEPLGSLRMGLLRLWDTPAAMNSALSAITKGPAIAALGAVASGDPVPREKVVSALRELFGDCARRRGRVWIVCDPLIAVDPASLEVLVEATEGPVPCFLIGQLPTETPMPAPLSREGGPMQLVLPPLSLSDGCRVTEAMLGAPEGDETAERLARLGGETPLGLVEAARTLVTAGDLVHDGKRFVWHGDRRDITGSVPTEAMLEERLGTLSDSACAVLEIFCVAPDGATRALCAAIAAARGIDEAAFKQAVSYLEDAACLTREASPRPTSILLRSVVLMAMPPERASDVYLVTADVIERFIRSKEGSPMAATVGWYRAEGGQRERGARSILDAARASAQAGLSRAALRLAAAAVQYDPSPSTRVAAAKVAQSRRRYAPPPPPGVTVLSRGAPEQTPPKAPAPPSEPSIGKRMVDAIRSRDFDAVDRFLDIAVAEGCDHSVAERLKAISHIARGDVSMAEQILARSEAKGNARTLLTWALVRLNSDDASGAVRDALRALADCRSKKDRAGENAAMRVLGICFSVLGRGAEAKSMGIPAAM